MAKWGARTKKGREKGWENGGLADSRWMVLCET